MSLINEKEDKPYSVMIVDDVPMMREMLRGALNHEGYREVYQASSSDEAWSMLNNWERTAGLPGGTEAAWYGPAIIFLDIHLTGFSNRPQKSGVDLLAEIRHLDGGTEAFVVMVSADTSRSIVNKALENGANGFLAKPISRKSVTQMLTRFERSR